MIFAVCMMTWMVSHRYFRLKGLIFVSYKKARSTKNKTKKQQHHERATTRSSYLYDFIRCFYLAAAKNAEMLKQRKDQATKQRHTVIYNTLYLGYQISFCFAWLLYLCCTIGGFCQLMFPGFGMKAEVNMIICNNNNNHYSMMLLCFSTNGGSE